MGTGLRMRVQLLPPARATLHGCESRGGAIFPTIVGADWRESIARARATPNGVREQIRERLRNLVPALTRRATTEEKLCPRQES
jgi:hypothetical protein